MKIEASTQRGSALIVATVTMALAAALAAAALSLATDHQTAVHREGAQAQARAAAEAGVHKALQELRRVAGRNPYEPLDAIDRLLMEDGSPVEYWIAEGATMQLGGRRYADYSVKIWGRDTGEGRQIVVTSSGYVPSIDAPTAHSTVQAVVDVRMQTAPTFDHGYYLDAWGWFYGDTVRSYGNAGANGQFDADGSQGAVHGTPRYEGLVDGDLIGYRDDNGDGRLDGSDGGIYTGWEASGCQNVVGLGGLEQNQHEAQAALALPNLQRLSVFEEQAHEQGSSIHLGGQVDAQGQPAPPLRLADAVQGDDFGEAANLVLIGTEENPIILDGPVVVRGDVVIAGHVTGQGAIYAGRNVYVAANLHYLDGPDTDLPEGNDEQATEAWLARNSDKDFLGLYARENVILGNHRDQWWRQYVEMWLKSWMNVSNEDHVGLDGIPLTAAGRDGIEGTEDDDLLELGDEWTVDRYTSADRELGLIPDGFVVGDPVPGSGEDLDGDGKRDGTIGFYDLELLHRFEERSRWAGNLPDDVSAYTDIATNELTRICASISSPHAIAMLTQAWDQDFRLFGSLSCRNEALVYGTDHLDIVYDRRLAGGSVFPELLPKTLAPIEVTAWRTVEQGTAEHLDPWF